MEYQDFGNVLNDQDDINDSSDEENLYNTSRFDPNESFSFIENLMQTDLLEFLDSDNENDSETNFNKKIDNIIFNLYESTNQKCNNKKKEKKKKQISLEELKRKKSILKKRCQLLKQIEKRTDSILDLYLSYDLLDDKRTKKMKREHVNPKRIEKNLNRPNFSYKINKKPSIDNEKELKNKDWVQLTGLPQHILDWLYKKIEPQIKNQTNRLSPKSRIHLFLTFLKMGANSYTILSTTFGVSQSYISREVNELVYIFLSSLYIISLDQINKDEIYCIDFAHKRERDKEDYLRLDVGEPSLSSKVLVLKISIFLYLDYTFFRSCSQVNHN
ncbi:hypothetical protein DICPUDRAFT_79389 [Dictyostelium purpureum]|uniref:Uncharacterized protein n=1 Tax=Dictyostelium purpureum TaxID=5786 RepID=F0ZMF6_DICPU|nr:uncharacterized protein DICPUDRAFT_79389 [Dictyostelium purpureum]EGC34858.1 hypothetical protein DICPUDRAFT_79389 [Dictyostelium purpureum]|eukprot:XP_003288612.1 hypothetical protein DICPUDRAFT_79389 [Dictyostelium purpureum]